MHKQLIIGNTCKEKVHFIEIFEIWLLFSEKL